MPELDTIIEMLDGVRLAATLYLPETDGPWPVLLEARPYRKDDLTAFQAVWYRRLRDEGDYAVCRLDLRGTGSSEGHAEDEYPPQEQRDLCEVIAWLAAQEWSTGAVGMYGKSYSGFNSLQVAMERPPALRAIIPMYATDDRYTDDVHYGGGARRGIDFVDYPLYMVAMNALPPVPSVYGPGWREVWEERVRRMEPWVMRWLEEQNDGPYWRHGSLRPNYGRIECATMIVSGWADGYHNLSFRSFEGLRCPKRLLIGPWSHMSPDASIPGPRIDFVPEMIRWWDRWLRGIDNGVDREPVVVFMRRSTRPEPDLDEVRGEWRIEPGWPPERGREDVLAVSDARAAGRGEREEDALEARGDVGPTGSIWCADELPFGPPFDQRPDEAYSLVYDWPQLEEELEILGHPRVEVVVRSTAPVAYLSAKLCDVFEDGTSALVSRGILNLTHRESHTDPLPLTPGETYRVTLELDATSWTFERGHRVRLDVAGSDWPSSWPPPTPATLTVAREGSSLVLPVLKGPPPGWRPAFRPPPEEASARDGEPPTWRIEHDVLGRERRVVIDHGYELDLEPGWKAAGRSSGLVAVSTVDPGDARAEGKATFRMEWPEATVGTEARGTVRSTADTYHLVLELDVTENGERRWSRRWEETFPRRLQ